MKQGTPSMPERLACSASCVTRSTSRSLASSSRVRPGSRPQSGGFHQLLAVGEVGAFGEIKLHQPLFHLRVSADVARPQDQPMAVERIRLSRDLVHLVVEALRLGSLRDTAGDRLVAFRRAELGGQVLVTADALA